MGTLTLYIIEWAFGLMLMLAVYKLLLSGTTFHRFNRAVLLTILGISALLPTLHIEVEDNPIAIHNTNFAHHIERVDTLALTDQGLAFVEVNEAKGTTTKTPLATDTTNYWPLLLVSIYVCYLAFFFTNWVRSTLKMLRFLRRCRHRHIGRWIRLCVHNLPYGPFNWMNYIVLSETEKRYSHNIAMLHELAHVRQLHFIDLIIVNFCALVNPVCWLLLKELKTVHEYEADSLVLSREHINPTNYQLQLIRLSVGDEAYALASTLNFNLKNRIIMMKRPNSNSWRKVCVLLLLPVAILVMLACGKSNKNDNLQAGNEEFNIVGAWIAEGVTWGNQHSDYMATDQYRRYKFILPDSTFCVTQLYVDSSKVHNYAHCVGRYEFNDATSTEIYTNGTSLDLQLSVIDANRCTTIYQGVTEKWIRATGLTPEQEQIIINDIKRQLIVTDNSMAEALNAAIRSNSRSSTKHVISK